MMKKISIFCALMLLSSCRNTSIHHDLEDLSAQTCHQLGQCGPLAQQNSACLEPEVFSLSRNEAVSLALQHNADLQAQFQQLGIARGDLVQAGFFTNPQVGSLFKFPDRGDETNLEITAMMNLSDFWQVPLRRKIAEDELEITSMQVLQDIIRLTFETKQAYNQCLYHQQRFALTQELYEKFTKLAERIAYRQLFGYETDYDIHVIYAIAEKWQAKVVDEQKMLNNAYLLLKKLLGSAIDPKPLALTDSLEITSSVPPLNMLENYGNTYRPSLAIALLKMRQAEHRVSFQKARIMDNVQFGLTYERDFERARGWGPALNFDIPIFDQKQGLIARAEYEYEQAKRLFRAEKRTMLLEINQALQDIDAHREQIGIFKANVLPHQQKALEYAELFHNRMQLNAKVQIEACIMIYESDIELITHELVVAQTKAQLEKSIGLSL